MHFMMKGHFAMWLPLVTTLTVMAATTVITTVHDVNNLMLHLNVKRGVADDDLALGDVRYGSHGRWGQGGADAGAGG